MTRYWAELAWLGGDTAREGVLIETEGDRIARIADAAGAPDDALALPGLTIPGLVNAHSHAFHRALRGRTQADRGSFWTWRRLMYRVAGRLSPASYRRLARAVFAEMQLAGITTVGEFHYVHHQPNGAPYDDPIAMERALRDAAADVGIRMTLLDTCYVSGGFGDDGHLPLSPEQARFGDGTGAAWAERATRVRDELRSSTLEVGAAAHSVRAVPPAELDAVVAWAHEHRAPLHIHVSEQPAENADCVRVHGRTPVALLGEHGAFAERVTAVHATHLTDDDIATLGGARANACFCVTTERDLADGIGPAPELIDAGATISLGSDSHAVIDLFEEARGVELGNRLRANARGTLAAHELLGFATREGARSLGWDDAGALAEGARADLTTVGLDTVRMAGWTPRTAIESVVFAATRAEVRHVVVAGQDVVRDGGHLRVPDVAGELSAAISAVADDETNEGAFA